MSDKVSTHQRSQTSDDLFSCENGNTICNKITFALSTSPIINNNFPKFKPESKACDKTNLRSTSEEFEPNQQAHQDKPQHQKNTEVKQMMNLLPQANGK
jgi:hypothetical protein